MENALKQACFRALCLISLFTLVSPNALAQTRFEESAAGYSAGWSQDSSRPWSGGTAAISATSGARASFSFSGGSATWIGALRPDTGIARVYVDGVLHAEVDTFSKTEETRVPVFTATRLANRSHTLTIEATGTTNPLSATPYIVVDAFDVPATALSRLQESDSDVSFTSGWSQDNTLNTFGAGLTGNWTPTVGIRPWSAGGAALSAVPGARATFSFRGTAVSWIGARGTQSGIARVYLDGAFVAEVDTYSPTEQIQAAVFTAAGLADTTHTLAIEATGRRNLFAQNALVVVDAFEVTRPGRRYQETDPFIVYGSGWIAGNRDRAYSEGAAAESNTPGAQATFTFNGTGVRWIGVRGPQTGIARIFLDGAFVQDVDTYAMTEGLQHTDFTATGLGAGSHTLQIQVIGKNPASTNFWVLIDAFDVIP